MSTRPCAREGCKERLGPGYRTHAKYCSAACRAAAAREREPGPERRATQKRTEPHRRGLSNAQRKFWAGVGRIQRVPRTRPAYQD